MKAHLDELSLMCIGSKFCSEIPEIFKSLTSFAFRKYAKMSCSLVANMPVNSSFLLYVCSFSLNDFMLFPSAVPFSHPSAHPTLPVHNKHVFQPLCFLFFFDIMLRY